GAEPEEGGPRIGPHAPDLGRSPAGDADQIGGELPIDAVQVYRFGVTADWEIPVRRQPDRGGARRGLDLARERLRGAQEVVRNLSPAARMEIADDFTLAAAAQFGIVQIARQHLEPFGAVVGVDVVHPLAAHFRDGAGTGRDADLSMTEALPDRQPPSLGQAREHRHDALALQQMQLDVCHAVENHDPTVEVVARFQLCHEILDEPAPAADEDQRRDVDPTGAYHLPPHVEEVHRVFPRFDGPDAQHERAFADALDDGGDGRLARHDRGQLVSQRHDVDRQRRQAALGQVRDQRRLVVLRRGDEEIGEGQGLDQAFDEYLGVPDIEVFGLRDGQDVVNEHAD